MRKLIGPTVKLQYAALMVKVCECYCAPYWTLIELTVCFDKFYFFSVGPSKVGHLFDHHLWSKLDLVHCYTIQLHWLFYMGFQWISLPYSEFGTKIQHLIFVVLETSRNRSCISQLKTLHNLLKLAPGLFCMKKVL